MVEHMLNVQPVLGQHRGDLSHHVGNVSVDDGDSPALSPGILTIREIDTVLDIAVDQVFLQLGGCHPGAVFLRFRCRSTQMRHGDHVGIGDDPVIREIGYIPDEMSGL